MAVVYSELMGVLKREGGNADPIPAAEVQAACQLILASDLFKNSPRMSRLLHFLVEKAISGAVLDTRESAIGIAVFDRNAPVYSTSEDPIVRVQVGRLRGKLKAYYSTLGADSDIEISIPTGGYMPVIRRTNNVNKSFKHAPTFSIHPFKCISHQGNGEHFTQGVYVELSHQLFKTFGELVMAHSYYMPNSKDAEGSVKSNAPSTAANHQLEGSIQIDTELIRASIRLIDASTGRIVWSERFNRNVSFIIAHQEELASSICNALKRFLLC
jgi:TolB-like protein